MPNRAGRTVKFLWKILREGMLTLLSTEQVKKTLVDRSCSVADYFGKIYNLMTLSQILGCLILK